MKDRPVSDEDGTADSQASGRGCARLKWLILAREVSAGSTAQFCGLSVSVDMARSLRERDQRVVISFLEVARMAGHLDTPGTLGDAGVGFQASRATVDMQNSRRQIVLGFCTDNYHPEFLFASVAAQESSTRGVWGRSNNPIQSFPPR